MGCDIHIYVEHKVDGKWIRVRDPNGHSYGRAPHTRWFDAWYVGRSYWLFSILAGVRGPFEPLVEPRGMPEDLSEEMAEIWEDWRGGDGHTPSYYFLQELLEYKDKKMVFTGVCRSREL